MEPPRLSMFENARNFAINGGTFNNVRGNSYSIHTGDGSAYPSKRGNYYDEFQRSSSSATVRPPSSPSPRLLRSTLTNLSSISGESEPLVQSPQSQTRILSPTELGRVAFSSPRGSFDLKFANNPAFPPAQDLRSLLCPEPFCYHENAVDYIQSVQDRLSFNHCRDFLDAIVSWWMGSLETSQLVRELSELLSSSTSLLEGLEVIIQLKESSSRIYACLSDTQTISFAILATAGSSQVIPVSSEAKAAMCGIQSTEDLRSVLKSSDALEKLLSINPLWIAPVMQLLQYELDGVEADSQYRKMCFKYFRRLAKTFHVLPPALFVKQLVREGPTAVRGGGFADIWKGRYGEQPACLKVLRMFIESDERSRRRLISDFCHEALIWKQLHHPNVLPFFGVNTDIFAPGFCLVSPWMANGDIMTYLKNHPDHDRLAAITEIALGMDYLHSLYPPIVHGDIRGANILVTDDGICCLADFGLALAAETQALATTTGGLRGSVRWLAPELIGPSMYLTTLGPDKRPRDVYAFGCTILEIVSGQVPFAHKHLDVAVIFDVCSGLRPPRPEGVWCPDEIWSLVEECWAQDSTQRPNSKTICAILAAQTRIGDTDMHIPRTASPEPMDLESDNRGQQQEQELELEKEKEKQQPVVITSHLPEILGGNSIDCIMLAERVPKDVTFEELWGYFTIDVPDGSKPLTICANFQQGCAFVKYKSDLALLGAIPRFNGWPLRQGDSECPRMRCCKLVEEDARMCGYYEARSRVMTEEGVRVMGRARGSYGEFVEVPVPVKYNERANGRRIVLTQDGW